MQGILKKLIFVICDHEIDTSNPFMSVATKTAWLVWWYLFNKSKNEKKGTGHHLTTMNGLTCMHLS